MELLYMVKKHVMIEIKEIMMDALLHAKLKLDGNAIILHHIVKKNISCQYAVMEKLKKVKHVMTIILFLVMDVQILVKFKTDFFVLENLLPVKNQLS